MYHLFSHVSSSDTFFNASGKSASSVRLGEVEDYRDDEARLCAECMMHTCSSYCMRAKKGKKNSGRTCRAGAGDEATKNKCDTPGFPLREEPAIVSDHRGFLKHEMPRDNLRLVQTPLHILRGWRGNCDFKILLYSSSSGEADPEEISRVTDYIVAYACKGNETAKVERELLKDFLLK